MALKRYQAGDPTRTTVHSVDRLNDQVGQTNRVISPGTAGLAQYGTPGTTFDPPYEPEHKLFELTQQVWMPTDAGAPIPPGLTSLPDVPYTLEAKRVWVDHADNEYGGIDNSPPTVLFFPTAQNSDEVGGYEPERRVFADYNQQAGRWECPERCCDACEPCSSSSSGEEEESSSSGEPPCFCVWWLWCPCPPFTNADLVTSSSSGCPREDECDEAPGQWTVIPEKSDDCPNPEPPCIKGQYYGQVEIKCQCGCEVCDDNDAPDTVRLLFDGVSDGNFCFACADINGVYHFLEQVSQCCWEGPMIGGGSSSSDPTCSLQAEYCISENLLELVIHINDDPEVIYELVVPSGFDCTTMRTLEKTFEHDPGECNWPNTMQVLPGTG